METFKNKIFPLKVLSDESENTGEPKLRILFMYDRAAHLKEAKFKGYPCVWVSITTDNFRFSSDLQPEEEKTDADEIMMIA
jgi:hypothetical protein